MELFFHDPEDIPLPPEKICIRSFRAEPYPDGKRVRVFLEISPFLKRPSGEVVIYNADQKEVSHVNIIETIDRRMEMTLHLREPHPWGKYRATAEVFYDQPLEPEGKPPEGKLPPTERMLVDQAEFTFEITTSGNRS